MPIMFSYFFVSVAYGMMMENAGFHWYYSLLASAAVYTGAFQFVLITFLSSGASILTVAVTALLMNSRQIFYSLSFVDEFKKMKKTKLYMIHTLTDETYAVDAALYEKGDEKRGLMFLIALFSHCWWLANGFAISPFSLPLEKKVFIPEKRYFNGLFGIFADSLPDAWGQLLLDRVLKEYKINEDITVLDRLALVGTSGMGALEYEPDYRIIENEEIDDLDYKVSGGNRWSKLWITRIHLFRMCKKMWYKNDRNKAISIENL